MTDEPDYARISALLTSYWKGAVIYSAIKVGLFEALGRGKASLDEISEATNCIPRLILQVLDCLERMRLVKSQGENWELTTDGMSLTRMAEYSLSSSAIMWWQEHLDTWRNLDYTLQTGKPAFERIYGKPFFEWLEKNEEERKLYQQSMREYARIDYRKVPEIINKYKPKRLIDIGGGTGALCEMILELNPNLEVCLLDKPGVIQEAKIKNETKTLKIKHVQGDFFHLPKSEYDAVILSRVLHDWEDSKIVQILEEVRNILSTGGHLFIIERLPIGTREMSLVNLDLAVTTGGTERTLEEYSKLLSDINYKLVQNISLENGFHVLVIESL